MATPVTNETKPDQTGSSNTPTSYTVPSVKTSILWKQTIIVGLATGVAWALILFLPLFTGNETLSNISLLAGIAPVVGGIYLGRRIKDRALVHGLLMAAFAVVAALMIATPIIVFSNTAFVPGGATADTAPLTKQSAFVSLLTLMMITLVPFPIYGTIISVRNQKRVSQFREEAARRGGQLERPGRVANIDDLQALSLPKFASWTSQLFKKNGFTLDEYKIDKDVVDLYLTRAESSEKWLVRCTVADAVKPGVAQQLSQDLREGTWVKGVVATSTTVQEGTRKWVKTRNNIEVLDGETLMEMNG